MYVGAPMNGLADSDEAQTFIPFYQNAAIQRERDRAWATATATAAQNEAQRRRDAAETQKRVAQLFAQLKSQFDATIAQARKVYATAKQSQAWVDLVAKAQKIGADMNKLKPGAVAVAKVPAMARQSPASAAVGSALPWIGLATLILR